MAEGSQAKEGGCQPPADLIVYYQQRIESFEAERHDLLERLDGCAVQQSELQRLDWAAKQRAEEVRELQKALSDAHTYLFEERERLLSLQAENDDLRLRAEDSHRQVHQLLHLPQGQLRQPMQEPTSRALLGTGGKENQQSPRRVARGMNMGPSPAALHARVESIQVQLAEQKKFEGERIAALLEDRRIREQDNSAHRALLDQKIEDLTARATKAETALQRTTKDYIIAQRRKQEIESNAIRASSSLQQQLQSAVESLKHAKHRASAQLKERTEALEASLHDAVETLTRELRLREDDLAAQAARAAHQQERLVESDRSLAKLRQQYKQLEYRRALDVEGFTSDITILRKHLAAVDRQLHQMRLVERLPDDERLEALLVDLQRKAPLILSKADNKPSSKGRKQRAWVTDVTGDLAAISASLQQMDQRVAKVKQHLPQVRRGQRKAAGRRLTR